DALLSVAEHFLVAKPEDAEEQPEASAVEDTLTPKLVKLCVVVHETVTQMAERFLTETKRRYFTTPTSYLELINLYMQMLRKRRREMHELISRFEVGLSKLRSTNKQVQELSAEIEKLKPELAESAISTQALIAQLAEESVEVNALREKAIAEESLVQAQTADTQAIAEDAQREREAVKALNSLNKGDISEVKGFKSPSDLVVLVLEAVCILLKEKPDWDNAKKVMGDSGFLKRLYDLDKDNIKEGTLRKLRAYIANPQFQPDIVAKKSFACKSLCMWVRAMDVYARVAKEVEPKKARLQEAKDDLAGKQ
ncbi:dynein heavy chain, partial [Kipferlia bialata]